MVSRRFLPPVGVGVAVLLQVLISLFSLQLIDCAAGQQFHGGAAGGEIQELTSIHNGRTGRADMNLLGAIGVEKLHRLPELGSPHDAVIHKEQLFPLNEIVHRNLLHFRHPVPFLLVGGHKAPGPGGGILDKGPGKGNAALIGIANGVGGAESGTPLT